MTEEQIKQEVERYINDTLYNYAIMIDGEWGSGKTYFVKHTLLTELENIEKENKQNRLVKYLSLYGCRTIEDIQEKLMWLLVENIEKRFKNRLSDMFHLTGKGKKENKTEIASIMAKKLGVIAKNKVCPEGSIYDLISEWYDFSKYIFIIDDLERCDCPLNEVFGLLNELVEHASAKLILVANEKEISGVLEPCNLELQYQLVLNSNLKWEENNTHHRNAVQQLPVSFQELERRRSELFPPQDADKDYKRIREKLIGITLRYEPDVDKIMTKIITSLEYDEDEKLLLQAEIDSFSSRMNYYQHHNLRTFQFFLSKVDYLLKRLTEVDYDIQYKTEIRQWIIEETFDEAVKLKSNFHPEKQNKDLLRIEQQMVSPVIKEYVENGQFNINKFEKAVLTIQEQIHASIPQNDPYYALYQEYYCHTQKWCEAQIEAIIEQLKKNRYPASFYGQIIFAVQRLIAFGFNPNYMKIIKKLMVQNLILFNEKSKVQIDLWMIEDENFKKDVRNIIDEINSSVQRYTEQTGYGTVTEILKKKEWVKELWNYTGTYSDGQLGERPVFINVETKIWIEKLKKADPAEIYDFRNWLAEMYPSNVRRKAYSQDARTIKEIRKELENIKEDDIIKKMSFQWLTNQMDQIIECNEPVEIK